MLALVLLCSPFVIGVPLFHEPELFEGDIELNGFNPFDRNAIINPHRHWPNGVVPYLISGSYSAAERETIEDAMHEIEKDTMYQGKTCIDFVPHTTQHDYTEVVSGSGCNSPVGHQGGHQKCTLSGGCIRKGTIMHELLHTLGFWHEQSTPDRDAYVTIMWNNIKSGKEHNFKKHSSSEATTYGLPYDYNSVMHYGAYDFSKSDTKPTIVAKQPGVFIGQRIRLSTYDIKKIQIMYGCISKDSTYMPPTVGAPTVYKDSCTFQNNMCDWHNIGNDDTNWERRKGRTPSGRTGPNYDHTLSYEGYYVYLEASSHDNDEGILVSKQYSPGSYCVTFYYHMMGKTEGTLRLTASDSWGKHILKSISGDHGDLWKVAQVPYTSSHSFQFQFDGVIGHHHYSDMAIDDVSVHSGNCPSGGVIG